MSDTEQLYFEMPIKRSLGIEDFRISDCNKLAFDLVTKFCKEEISTGVISGPPFSGKSHLCKILIKQITNKNIILIDRIEKDLLETIDSCDFLIIENINNIQGINEENHLFHAINFIKQNHKQLLLTSQDSLVNIDLTLEDLKSRLEAMIEASISEPDDKLMESIIIKIFNDRQLLITPKVLNFLMKRLERSYKEINHFIEIIDKTSLKKGKKISIKLINDLLN